MSDTRDAFDHDPLASMLPEARQSAGLDPWPDNDVDTWADVDVDPWRYATTQRSRNFDAWTFSASREYKATQPARNVLRRMANAIQEYSDYFPKPGIARGRAVYRETHVHETLTRELLVHEIHQLLDEKNRLEGYDANSVPPGYFHRPRVERINSQIAELLKQLFAADNAEPIQLSRRPSDDPALPYWLSLDGTEKTPRPFARLVELLTRSLDRAPGAPNNG